MQLGGPLHLAETRNRIMVHNMQMGPMDGRGKLAGLFIGSRHLPSGRVPLFVGLPDSDFELFTAQVLDWKWDENKNSPHQGVNGFVSLSHRD